MRPARSRGSTPSTTAPHGPIDVGRVGVDVLICSPYKFFGPHLGLAFGKEELLERWRPYKVRPAPTEPVGARFETGTLPHELLAGFVAAIDYIDSIGWDAIIAWERELGERFLAGLPERLPAARAADDGGPRADVRLPGRRPEPARGRRAARRAGTSRSGGATTTRVETMRHLGLDEEGAVRAGMLHYNTLQEVDRLLAALDAL